MDIKIDKGVPIPLNRWDNRWSKWRSLLKIMEVGDSVLLESKEALSFQVCSIAHLKGNKKIMIRRQDDQFHRCWLIEKGE